jgi:hypothetical protein
MNLLKLLTWIVFLVMGLSALAFAQIPELWLIPKSHFLYTQNGRPLRLYFQKNTNFEIQKLEIKGLRVQNWSFMTDFQKTWLELILLLKPGTDQEFDHLQITDSKGIEHSVFVGVNRVMSFKPSPTDDLSFERLESSPMQGVFFTGQFFNLTDLSNHPREITILAVEYAPKALSGQVLLEPNYDPRWFDWLFDWSSRQLAGKDPESSPLPRGVKFEDSRALKLKVKPSFGASMAILTSSITPGLLCSGIPSAQIYWQILIKYRLGSGEVRYYPIPTISPMAAGQPRETPFGLRC